MIFLWTGLGIALLAALYLLALRGRRNHPDWKTLDGARFAHRGLHGAGVPENSITAFQRAVEKDFGIELDVHLLADGNLAVFHDNTLLRMTGIDGKVEEQTVESLQQYRLGETEEKIPLFTQVLELVDGKVPLVIELKSVNNPKALTDRVMETLSSYGGPYCIESFDPRVVRCLRKKYPQVIRGQLSRNFFVDGQELPWILRLLMTAHLLNFLTHPDFVAYQYSDRKRFGTFLVRKLWGVRGVAWTLRKPHQLRMAEKEGWLPIFEKFLP